MSRKLISVTITTLVAGAAVAATAFASGGTLTLGPSSNAQEHVYKGYYDGHLDTFLALDVSNKAQAAAAHLNYAPVIGKTKGAPPQYFFQGKAAAGQVSVFGLTEPGKPNYTPLWDVYWVTWKPGVTPTLMKVDDDIKAAAKAGKLTVTDAHMVLNAPITSVGK